MKVGSIVVCLPNFPISDEIRPFIKWTPVCDEQTPYILREFHDGNEVVGGNAAVLFEEGIIGRIPFHIHEICFPADWCREILPPEDISEQVEEMMLQPIENYMNNTQRQ